jgi:hypothetical protein
MATRFRDFLLKEIMVDVDPNDPESINKIRQNLRTAQVNPDAVQRTNIQRAQLDRQQAQQDQGPTAALQARIAKTKEYLAKLEWQLNKLQQKNTKV